MRLPILRFDDAPGVPDHRHDHEDVSKLLSGQWTVTIDGVDSELERVAPPWSE